MPAGVEAPRDPDRHSPDFWASATIEEMAKKNPRRPRGYSIDVGDRVLERRYCAPETWEHRDRLAAVDARYGMNGAWVRAIDEVFGAAWLREQRDALHSVAIAMSWSWPIAVIRLAEVADLVLAVRAAAAGGESVLKRLRVHEQFAGACFEARVARWLARAGLPFHFTASSSGERAPDLVVGGVWPFAVEVKHVANSDRSQVEETLSNLVSPQLFFERPDAAQFRFDWSGPEVQEAPLAELTSERLIGMVTRVEVAVRERLASASNGASFEVPVEGIGRVFVSLDAPPGRTSIAISAGGDQCRNPMRLAKQIRAAANQLDASVPGVVVLGADPLFLGAEHAVAHGRDVLGSEGHAMSHVAGAIVLGASADGTVEHTIPIQNPHARVSLDLVPLPVARAPLRSNRFEDFGDPFNWPE